MKHFILPFFYCLTWISAYAQNPTDLLDQYLSNYHSEKIYVNHDKPYYIISGDGAGVRLVLGMQQISHPGFYQAKVFYTPHYDQSLEDQSKSDYRVTLHWQPNLEITDTAQNFEFYTGDIEGDYLI